MPTPLAHSACDGIPPQTYAEHITNVHFSALANAKNAAAFYTSDRDRFIDWVKCAALYHDLGKLDALNQKVLRSDSRDPLPVPHVDAGVAALWGHQRKESAVLVAAHHAGLFSKCGESPPNRKRLFRDERTPDVLGGRHVDEYVDVNLPSYLTEHGRGGLEVVETNTNGLLQRCGFTRRIALSCLVDADHGDTARHYQREVETCMIEPKWNERAVALQRYVDSLPQGNTERERRRNLLRRRVYEVCRDAPLEPAIRACDAPVGSGKTTAVMTHLLRVAAERKSQLRHIFVVLPYTNIITQAVEVYRKSLVLEDERPEDVVVEHHHQADFEDLELRQLATLWKAPIIVTTAVQFFETLGSHHPARLRKLHELPGSALFVDEAHAAMPSHLWPQMWRWLETWTRDWGGHLVLASGSLPRFWTLPEYQSAIRGNTTDTLPNVPDLVLDEAIKTELKDAERHRIRYHRRAPDDSALDCDGLVRFVLKKLGPRLVIVNTVQTAAVIANLMRKAGYDVLHLSTALAPAHRELMVKRIKLRLRKKIENWTLVATSCVEAGMDFSFRTGFRERASTASLIQISGRVSRGNEHENAEVWDLLLRDDSFRHNPALKVSQQALDRFSEEELNCLPPAELATSAMRREWTCGAEEKAKELVAAEEGMEYPDVARLGRVIDADTLTVITDAGLIQAIERNEKVSKIELLRYSVQMWATKVSRLGLEPIDPRGELYAWKDTYDPDFLGYMAGVLKNERFMQDNDAWII